MLLGIHKDTPLSFSRRVSIGDIVHQSGIVSLQKHLKSHHLLPTLSKSIFVFFKLFVYSSKIDVGAYL